MSITHGRSFSFNKSPLSHCTCRVEGCSTPEEADEVLAKMLHDVGYREPTISEWYRWRIFESRLAGSVVSKLRAIQHAA